jgi:uncharacterized protein with von Willebrand factor type A (vWA) domain
VFNCWKVSQNKRDLVFRFEKRITSLTHKYSNAQDMQLLVHCMQIDAFYMYMSHGTEKALVSLLADLPGSLVSGLLRNLPRDQN